MRFTREQLGYIIRLVEEDAAAGRRPPEIVGSALTSGLRTMYARTRPTDVNGHVFSECDPVMGEVWWCAECGANAGDLERVDEQCSGDFPEPTDAQMESVYGSPGDGNVGQERYMSAWRQSQELHR